MDGDQREPAEQQANRIVHRFAEHVQIRPLLGPQRWDVVDHSHHPEPERREKEVRIQRPRQRQSGGGERQPFGVGERRADLAGRHGAKALLRVQPVLRAVEQLVEHVVAGRDEAGRGHRQRQRSQAVPTRHTWFVEERQDDAEQHEDVLEPVVDARDLHVRPQACRRERLIENRRIGHGAILSGS